MFVGLVTALALAGLHAQTPAVLPDGKPASSTAGEYPLSLADIRVRDPFILADRESQTYYLYAQGGNRALNELNESRHMKQIHTSI